ncbi:MAG: prepilin peptidase [Planctomycetales bacterium]|nr:prepilin peptidase [Planctomycetales bacterium]
MSLDSEVMQTIAQNWVIWFVTIVLVVAAVIDGKQLRVPNWLTYPMVISGWIYGVAFSPYAGWEGLGYSLVGTIVGLAVLLPAYAIGGMGAGDVKLMAGVGAWLAAFGAWQGVGDTFFAFCVSAVVGGVIAVGMVLWTKTWSKHFGQFFSIWQEIISIRNPETLATIAAERKSTMFLLPYGIPMAIGTIAYFAWMGMLL